MKYLLLTTIAAVFSGNVLLAEPFDQKLYDTKARTYSPEAVSYTHLTLPTKA